MAPAPQKNKIFLKENPNLFIKMNKLIKKILASMLVALIVTASANASDISFGNDPVIYDWSGSGNLVLNSYTAYVIRLYESVDNAINFGIVGGKATNTIDDIWSGIQFYWNPGSVGGGVCTTIIEGSDSTYNIINNNKIYSVVFNSASVANGTGAGYFAIIDDSPTTVIYPGPGVFDYNPGGVVGGLVGSGGGWQQVIPEPATALLFGFGGMGAWLLRRNKLKSKEDEEEAA